MVDEIVEQLFEIEQLMYRKHHTFFDEEYKMYIHIIDSKMGHCILGKEIGFFNVFL
jgi:hypothetical protein